MELLTNKKSTTRALQWLYFSFTFALPNFDFSAGHPVMSPFDTLNPWTVAASVSQLWLFPAFRWSGLTSAGPGHLLTWPFDTTFCGTHGITRCTLPLLYRPANCRNRCCLCGPPGGTVAAPQAKVTTGGTPGPLRPTNWEAFPTLQARGFTFALPFLYPFPISRRSMCVLTGFGGGCLGCTETTSRYFRTTSHCPSPHRDRRLVLRCSTGSTHPTGKSTPITQTSSWETEREFKVVSNPEDDKSRASRNSGRNQNSLSAYFIAEQSNQPNRQVAGKNVPTNWTNVCAWNSWMN